MFIKKYIPFLILPVLVLLQTGCTKHADGIPGPAGQQGPPGPPGSAKASAITGFILLYDEYGIARASSAGVTISTLKGDSLVKATTDSLGKFSLPPLPSGNYDLHITKPGYDSLKTFVQHSGGDEAKFIGDIHMSASLTSHVTNGAISISDFFFNDHILIMDVSFDGPPSTAWTLHHFNFYFSKSQQVGRRQYDGMAEGNNEATSTNTYQLQYILENLTAGGATYKKGDVVYIKTYVSPVPRVVTTWFDYATYRTIDYPYIGDSAVSSFVWPF